MKVFYRAGCDNHCPNWKCDKSTVKVLLSITSLFFIYYVRDYVQNPYGEFFWSCVCFLLQAEYLRISGKSWTPLTTMKTKSKCSITNQFWVTMSVREASRAKIVVPLSLEDAKEPPIKRIVGPNAPGGTCHITIDHGGNVPYWEGQSYGVIPPVRISTFLYCFIYWKHIQVIKVLSFLVICMGVFVLRCTIYEASCAFSMKKCTSELLFFLCKSVHNLLHAVEGFQISVNWSRQCMLCQ